MIPPALAELRWTWRRRAGDLVLTTSRRGGAPGGDGSPPERPRLPPRLSWREDASRIDLGRRPRQGMLGDCWVMAALLAVHEVAPERIAAMLREGVDGTWEVLLPGARGGTHAVRVDRTMPVDGAGRWVYAHESGAGPGWAGLLEKALALRAAGSYRLLARGFGRSGLRALTGSPVRSHIVRLPDAAQMDAWVRDGHAVLASSHPLSPLVRTADGRWPLDHVMAVVGADPRSGHVDLRNPWRPDSMLQADARTFRRAVLCVDVTARPLV